MRRIALVILAALLLTGCSGAGPSTTPVKIYFVGDTAQGLKLFSEFREFDGDGDQLAESVISELVSGGLQPLDPDYTNLWDGGTELLDISIEGNAATVDLKLGSLNVGAEGEALAIGQIVWTLTELSPQIASIRFLGNGKKVESFAGHVDTTVTFARQADFEVLSAIQILSPQNGQDVSNPVVITGEACTFEANVSWELLSGGIRVSEGSTTALEACPTRSAWKVELGRLAAGDYTFVAREFSPKDGSLLTADSKNFRVNG